MKIFYILFIFFLITNSIFSQSEIKGQVKDSITNESIVGASVTINGTNIVTYTDFDGNYKLNDLKIGNYNLIFTFISYHKKHINISIDKKKEEIVTIDVELNAVK